MNQQSPTELWGTRSLDRARRWLERIRSLAEGSIENTTVSDQVRQDIEDFVAAAVGEATEVLEKAKTQLENAYAGRGESKRRAQERALAFVNDWLRPRPLMRGILAVRHLDVHVEGRYSGRLLQISPGDPANFFKAWWTFPGIPPAQHALLRASSQLTPDELAQFNQHMLETNLLDVLSEMIADVSDFQSALAAELR